jgi:hypothetical protein
MWPISAPMSVAGRPHSRPVAAEPLSIESSIAAGSGQPTFRACRIPLAHQRSGCGLRQRLDRSAVLSRPLRGGMPVVGLHRRLAESGAQLFQRREAVLDVSEG